MNTEELAQHNEELPLEDPDEVMLQDQEKKMKTISKKGITFSNFKMHKKLAQGIKVRSRSAYIITFSSLGSMQDRRKEIWRYGNSNSYKEFIDPPFWLR